MKGLILFLLLSLSGLLIAQSDNEFLNINREFLNLKPVSVAAVPESGITIEKEAAVFNINKGSVYRLSNVDEKEWALFFKAEGEFIFTPPTKIENDQLKRFMEKEILHEKFSSLFILFSDTSNLFAISELDFKEQNDSKVSKEVKKVLSYLNDSEQDCFDTDFIKAALEDNTNSLFYAHIELTKGDPLFYESCPYEDEEVFLMQKKSSGYVFGTKEREIINNFHKASKYKSNKPFSAKPNDFFIDGYRIKINVEGNLDFTGECEAVVQASENARRWIRFYLHPDLLIDSVFVNGKKENCAQFEYQVWLKLPENENIKYNTIKFFYHGDLLEKTEYEMILLKSSLFWFPNYGNRSYSFYDITFSVPEKLKIMCVGENVSSEVKNEKLISRWVTKAPIRNASFNIGNFDTYTYSDNDGNKVNVFISESALNKIARELVNYEVLSGSNMEEKIGTDILASMQFYQNIYGKIPLQELNVTPIPYSHSEASPGLVHLSWSNYQGIADDKSGEITRAHETAHQWWGIGVDFETYHDQWLSEAFAHYSALWFVQVAFQDNKEFFKILDNWKEEIMSNRKYLFGSGQEAGPIWLGYRTQSSSTEGDFLLIVYKKGAWVLHMLRNMLLDLKTMNEDSFMSMMKDFFKQYNNKRASTEDFKRIAEKYCGDLSWFFDQYVYGTEIPSYKFSSTVEKNNNGKYIITCKVLQEDAVENFKMCIPIKILFKDDRFARLRIEVKGKETIINLPPLNEVPEEIIFNDLNSVLCDVDYE